MHKAKTSRTNRSSPQLLNAIQVKEWHQALSYEISAPFILQMQPSPSSTAQSDLCQKIATLWNKLGNKLAHRSWQPCEEPLLTLPVRLCLAAALGWRNSERFPTQCSKKLKPSQQKSSMQLKLSSHRLKSGHSTKERQINIRCDCIQLPNKALKSSRLGVDTQRHPVSFLLFQNELVNYFCKKKGESGEGK